MRRVRLVLPVVPITRVIGLLALVWSLTASAFMEEVVVTAKRPPGVPFEYYSGGFASFDPSSYFPSLDSIATNIQTSHRRVMAQLVTQLARLAILKAAKELGKKIAKKKFTDKIHKHVREEMKERGWSEKEIDELLKNPHHASNARLHEGRQGTAYFDKKGNWIVVDKAKGQVIQANDKFNPLMRPNPNQILDPYYPPININPVMAPPQGDPAGYALRVDVQAIIDSIRSKANYVYQ